MEVRKGYKQTEVGIIPEDWDVKKLGDCLLGKPEYGINAPAIEFSDNFPAYIRITDVTEDGKFSSEKRASVDVKGSDKYFLDKGDLVFARTGASVGKTYLYNPKDGVLVFAGFLIRVKPNTSKLLPEFLAGCVTTKRYWNWVQLMSMRSGQPGINGNEYSKFLIPLPSLPEQKAIAAALSDVDSLLTSLDALIAKKRLIKQGTMQELLTGKKRLPGFGGEWEVKSLGDLFDFSGGFTASRDQLSSEGYCYLHYGDIHKSNKTYIDVSAEFQDIPKLNVPLKKISEVSLLKDGDVVFVDASEDDEGASKHVVVDNPDGIPFISGLHTIVAKSKTDELAYLYRRYCFQTRAVKNQFLFYAVGTKVTGISKSNIAKINIPVPSLPEQTAIAEILSDMDAEISALEARREKTRLLKQGMMQELLTGRIRLV